MFPSTTLLTFILAAFSLGSASAIPSPRTPEPSKFNLAFAAHVNSTGFANIVAADQARAKALKAQGNAKTGGKSRRASSFAVTNAVVTYTAAVGVGSPATTYTLIIDTGSSNTWVGAGISYVKTSTSKSTGDSVSVTYGSGSFSGTEFIDQVTLSPSLIIKSQSIGVASTSSGFQGVDGILGIGPTDLTVGTVSGVSEVPTVTDNLFSQGTISTDLVSVFFAPTTSESVTNGELTFGGTDTSKTTTSITFVPITSTSPASEFWGVTESITYGTTSILSTTAGIVDTGTTLILIASNAFTKYKSATGATLDSATGLLKITSAQFAALKPLNFDIGGTTYTLSANAQIWPRSLNTDIGGTSSSIYLVVNSIGTPSGQGLDFINGYTFLERFYSVFDTTNSRIGFAQTAFTTATTN